jgi:hypothetical protein
VGGQGYPPSYHPKGPLRVVLLDALGRQVQEERMSGSTLSLSTSTLPAGLYYLHLTDGTRWLAGGKVVVE